MNCDQVQNHGFSISSNVALVAVQGFQLKKLITSLESCLFTEVLNRGRKALVNLYCYC